MKINIKANKLMLTDALHDYCQLKMKKLKKYLGGLPVLNCDITVAKEVGGQRRGEIFRAQVNLQLSGKLLRVEKAETDLYKAIDKVQEHLELAIKRHKDKLTTKLKTTSVDDRA